MRFCFRPTPMKAFLPTYRYTKKKGSRIAREARQTANNAQACEPTRTFPFLLLPRELRDYIYDYAFGSEITVLTPSALILEAWPKGRKSENGSPDKDIATHYPYTLPAYTKGLPLWLLTNKQICSEALSYFGTVRTFASGGFSQIARYPKNFFPLTRKPNCRTPLVLNDDVIRNVTIRTKIDDYLWRDSFFLRFLDRLDTKELELRLEWSVRGLPLLEDWIKDLDACIIKSWDTEKWGGRFGKVVITIPTGYYGDELEVSAARFDQVEALARRLVGNVGTVIWGPFIRGYYNIYKRSVVVDKKD
ncbi:unnamed protein product [Alternaria alternata]